jgi:hypothetical protein
MSAVHSDPAGPSPVANMGLGVSLLETSTTSRYSTPRVRTSAFE